MNKPSDPLYLILLTLFIVLSSMSVAAQSTREATSGTRLPKSKSVFLANPAANLDQCANGGVGSLSVDCSGAAWQNGNLGVNQAHYLEGESVPYRLRFSNLTVGSSYTVTIEYDTTENSGAKHAIDCLTSFDRTETTADPCSDVIGCTPAGRNDFPIPADPNFIAGSDLLMGTGDDIPLVPGVFSLFNGTITAVSPYTLTGSYAGASQTKITLTFTAGATNTVLAWGGHISTRVDWGVNNSAIAITGSPYHMRLIDLDGTGGNQDRSLSSAATVFPGKITIIKDARPNSNETFNFSASGPAVSGFSLTDDGTNAQNTQSFNNLTNFGAANTVVVTENASLSAYSLTQISCVEDSAGGTGQNNTTVNLPGRLAEIILEEGESVTCTFVNTIPTAALATIGGRITDVDNHAVQNVTVKLTSLLSGETRWTRSNTFGFYRFEELPVGETYMLSATSRRRTFVFDYRLVTLIDDIADVDFTALPF